MASARITVVNHRLLKGSKSLVSQRPELAQPAVGRALVRPRTGAAAVPLLCTPARNYTELDGTMNNQIPEQDQGDTGQGRVIVEELPFPQIKFESCCRSC
jgi:hypothetical protein